MKPSIHRLGDLQLKIMKILWERREATVSDVHKILCKNTEFAYTTVATLLKRMEEHGLIKHRLEDRKFLYRPVAKEEDVTRDLSDHLVKGLFEGSLADMVSHLLKTREVSQEELDRLEKLIAEQRKKL